MTKLSLVAVGLAMLVGCSNEGYVGRCDNAVRDLRGQFEYECNQKNDRTLHDGTLKEILQKRDRSLRANECDLQCETWTCSRGSYYGSGLGDYKSQIERLADCGSNLDK